MNSRLQHSGSVTEGGKFIKAKGPGAELQLERELLALGVGFLSFIDSC